MSNEEILARIGRDVTDFYDSEDWIVSYEGTANENKSD